MSLSLENDNLCYIGMIHVSKMYTLNHNKKKNPYDTSLK